MNSRSDKVIVSKLLIKYAVIITINVCVAKRKLCLRIFMTSFPIVSSVIKERSCCNHCFLKAPNFGDFHRSFFCFYIRHFTDSIFCFLSRNFSLFLKFLVAALSYVSRKIFIFKWKPKFFSLKSITYKITLFVFSFKVFRRQPVCAAF